MIQGHSQRLDQKKRQYTKSTKVVNGKENEKLHKELLGSYQHFQEHKQIKEELELKLNVLKRCLV